MLLASRKAPLHIVAPSLFLSLTLSLTELHKISFLSRPRPVIEIYSVRSGRPQLIFESEWAPRACIEHAFDPMLLRIDACCHSQLERDIFIRVTHIVSSSSSSSDEYTTGHVRQLLGEHYTNLFALQSAKPGSSSYPLLRPRPLAEAHKGGKQKGTLVIQSQNLCVRTSAGLLAYPGCHPNRCLPETFPPIFEQTTDCQIAFTVQRRSLAGLADARFAKALHKKGHGTSSSTRAKPPRLAPFLEFYRCEFEGTWSAKPVHTTEEIWAGSSLANAAASAQDGKGADDPYATLTWRPVQLDLFALCFGEVRRNVLVRVMLASGALGGAPTVLASFQFSVAEVLGRRDAAVVVLDQRVTAIAAAQAANAVFKSEGRSSQAHPVGSPNSARSDAAGASASASAAVDEAAMSPRVHPGSASVSGLGHGDGGDHIVQGGLDDSKPACILFQRVHVYSALASLQKMVQRAGVPVKPLAQIDAAAPTAAAAAAAAAVSPAVATSATGASTSLPPLTRVISGLHQILLDQEKRKSDGGGVDRASNIKFADQQGEDEGAARAAAAAAAAAAPREQSEKKE